MSEPIQRRLTLRLYPSHAVLYRTPVKKSILTESQQRSKKYTQTKRQIDNQKNLTNNNHNGYLSRKASKRLKNAINWLVLSSKNQIIENSRSNKKFTFKISFITLTLPSDQGEISDQDIKGKALKGFIQNLRNKYGMNSYVWKAEAQKNGNIHIHFTTNIFISKADLNNIWLRQLKDTGLINKYSDKFGKMTFEEYFEYRKKQGEKDFNKIKKAYVYGQATKWLQPNCTDVRNVQKVRNLGAYLATYFSKKDNSKRPINGVIWSCSYNLSDKNKCTLEFNSFYDYNYLKKLDNECERSKEIYTDNENPLASIWLCTWFGYDVSKIFNSGLEKIKKALREHVMAIRYYDYTVQYNQLKV